MYGYDMVIADAINLAVALVQEDGYDEKDAAYEALVEIISQDGEAFEDVATRNGLMHEAAKWLVNNPRVTLGALQEVLDGTYYGGY